MCKSDELVLTFSLQVVTLIASIIVMQILQEPWSTIKEINIFGWCLIFLMGLAVTGY